MDPAQDNSANPQDQQKTVIEPGQFVVAQAGGAPAQNGPNPAPPPPGTSSSPLPPITPQQHTASTGPDLQQAVSQALAEENPTPQPQSAPTPIIHLAQTETQAAAPQPNQPPIPPASPASSQPDPALFTPPAGTGTTATAQDVINNHKSGILKNVFIGVGALILIGILGGAVYFFIIQKNNFPLGAKSTVSGVTQVDEPPSVPKRTTGGFANLPPVTQSATQSATPSGALIPQF